MKRIILVLAALALCGIAAAVFWLSGPPAQAPAASQIGVEASSLPAGDASLPTGAAQLEPAKRDETHSERATVALADAALDDATPRRTFSGRVARPADCSLDPEVEVFALANEMTPALFFGTLDTSAPSDAGPTDKATAATASKHSQKHIVARAKLDAEQRFSLELPATLERTHLFVAGRYWYSRASVEVETRDGAVVLPTMCGACITGTLELPAARVSELSSFEGSSVRATLARLDNELMQSMGGRRRSANIAEGRFEIRALPASSYRVELASELFASHESKLDDLPPGRDTHHTLRIQTGGTLAGRVVDAAGAPVEGAEVAAKSQGGWFGFDDRPVRTGTSGADGSFELKHVRAGKLKVVAEKAGMLENKPVEIELADEGRAQLVVTLDAGNAIAGTITWPDLSPAAEVEIEVDFDPDAMMGMGAFNMRRGAEGKAKSDATGRFRVEGLGAGPFRVRAKQVRDAAADATAGTPLVRLMHAARAEGVKPNTLALALVLQPLHELHGRVVDPSGAPVKSFKIQRRAAEASMMDRMVGGDQTREIDDELGRFTLSALEEGKYEIEARSAGFAPNTAQNVEVPRASDAGELILTLPRAASVLGLVRAPDGSPVAGAEVRLDDGSPDWTRRMSGANSAETKSDAQGAFRLDGLRGGQLALVAESAAWARSAPVSVEIAAGEEHSGVVLQLRAGGRIHGTVFHNAKPAPGLLVQATQQPSFNQAATQTDARGEFVLERLTPGTWQIVALPTDGALAGGADGESFDQAAMLAQMKMASVEIQDGVQVEIVLGAAPEDPVEVSGRVTHAGKPFAGGTLTFSAGGKDALAALKMATVDADGSYRVTLDKPGSYSISAQRLMGSGGQQSAIEFRRTIQKARVERLDFELPTGRISGRVRGPDGQPASGARISLAPHGAGAAGTMWGGAFHELVADDAGLYEVEMLDAGRYELTAGGAGFAALAGVKAKLGAQQKSVSLSAGEWLRDIDFRLETAVTVEVRVRDERGEPVAEAVIFARNESGSLVERFSLVTSDAAGTARYSGLSSGRYTFSARKGQLSSADSASVRVAGDTASTESQSVELRLSSGTLLIVRTVDAAGAPVAAAISVVDSEGREHGLMVGMSEIMTLFTQQEVGERRIGPLPPGKYKVRATPESGASVEKPVTLSGQAERKLKIEFGG